MTRKDAATILVAGLFASVVGTTLWYTPYLLYKALFEPQVIQTIKTFHHSN